MPLGMMSVARGAALMLAEGGDLGVQEGSAAGELARVMLPAPVIIPRLYVVAHFASPARCRPGQLRFGGTRGHGCRGGTVWFTRRELRLGRLTAPKRVI